MNKNKTTLALTTATALVAGQFVLAATGAHGGAEEIPWDKIAWQAANLGILLGAIFLLIKQTIIEGFKNRQKNYIESAEKTKSALREAEMALAGVKEKLSTLELGEQKAVEVARSEAEAIKAQIIKEAVLAAEKIKKDAQLTILNETAKAKSEIGKLILEAALVVAEKNLSTVGAAQAGQEDAFIKQIGQART